MEDLRDIMQRYKPEEPSELTAIKAYVFKEFKVPCSVGLQGEEALVITVKSAALANTLRLRVPALQAAANTKKRLIFRIG